MAVFKNVLVFSDEKTTSVPKEGVVPDTEPTFARKVPLLYVTTNLPALSGS